MTIREEMNQGNANRLDSDFQVTKLGELFTLVIKGLTPTQSGLAISSDVATMSATPTALFQVKGIGGVGEIKKLLRGASQPDGTILPVPNPGEVVWNGATKLRFNTDDAETTCDVTYAKSTDLASCLMRANPEPGDLP